MKSRISKPSYETWLKQAEPKELTGSTFIISVPNDFIKNWLDKRYKNFIEDTVFDVIGSKLTIHFEIMGEEEEQINNAPFPDNRVHNNNNEQNHMLNPKYKFETFVVGAANRFAHAASLAVAEAPAKAYNPLFIYGGVGLGKTHLMHAIAHYVREHHPERNVIYLSSEKFTNEFINAIMDNKAETFRNKYRNVDILLVDDIQFLAGKEQTQEEFFH